MNYENPHIPEEINVSKEHPLKEFASLLIGAIILVIVVSVVLGVSGSWLASKIPYKAEAKVASLYDVSTHSNNEKYPELITYLQTLADKISKVQNLPEEMKIKIHYMDSDTVNAFATLGGNVFMFKGLLQKLPNENSLVTLLGHEIAHVKYRHPIRAFGGGVAVAIAMTTLGRSADSQILGDAGLLSTLKFSRDNEKQSDLEAMHTLHSIYGHLNGGAQLFKIFQDARTTMDSKEPAEFFSTHPQDEKRIQSFTTMANEKGWTETGEITPLPDFFKKSFR
jgi:predicted Zn-dependent protease